MKTPLTIELMLVCYYSLDAPGHFGSERWNAPATRETLSWLQRNELVGVDLRATERGRVWVDYIINTPLPVKKWELSEERRPLDYSLPRIDTRLRGCSEGEWYKW